MALDMTVNARCIYYYIVAGDIPPRPSVVILAQDIREEINCGLHDDSTLMICQA